MNLYDIRSEEEWQNILDRLCDSLGMPTALVDPHSFVLQESGERHELCKTIRANKETLISICAQTQKFMANKAKEKKRPVIVACEAKMSKCLIPVFSDGEFMGSVVVCGTALPDEEITTRMIAEALSISEEEVIRLSKQVKVMGEEKVAQIADRIYEEIHS
jgi:ligand-binding sensor protein